MKKEGPSSKLTVKRISNSPYFANNFYQLEKQTIQNLTGAEMLPENSNELADILITNSNTDIQSISESQLKFCKLLIHPNSGYDNFSSDFVTRAQFPIVLGNPIRSHAVTNFILSALFAHYSPIPSQMSWDAGRKWPRKLLSELNILILGYGHIGKLISTSLTPLVSKISIYDPHAGFPSLDLDNVDVLIPVCSLNKSTKSIIDEKMFLKLNEDFLLINASRGSLVNTHDLIKVLSSKPSAFAVLDVFEKEPADFGNFKSLKNISLSSHIAGVYQNIDLTTANFEARAISDFVNYDLAEFERTYKNLLLKNRLKNLELI
jgi:phosphoglycerate dehydrogenase-like enzyme